MPALQAFAMNESILGVTHHHLASFFDLIFSNFLRLRELGYGENTLTDFCI